MGKKAATATFGPQMSVTIREASTGKKHTNAKSLLKLQHIKNLAMWASHDAAIPSLGAFFAHHLAASSEALMAPVDPSLFACQRCESILLPGSNCTTRIEKNKINSRRKGKKASLYPRNNIVYTCHFCSHRNMKRGTPRNTSPPKAKARQEPKHSASRAYEPTSSAKRRTSNAVSPSDVTKDNVAANTIADDTNRGKMGITEISETLMVKDDPTDIAKGSLAAKSIVVPLGSTRDDSRGKTGIMEVSETFKVDNDLAESGPATPKTTMTLLESKMRKRNRSGAKKTVAFEATSEASNADQSVKTSNRRRRKSWTSLKEVAENDNNNNSRRLMNLTVPFSMQ